MNTREYWISILEKLSENILYNLSNDTLKENMSFEGDEARKIYSPLEAFSRLLMGIAPWLENDGKTGLELELSEKYRQYARTGLKNATNPKASDFMNFTEGGQPLVDAAFLSLAIIRAKTQLWDKLDLQTKENVITCMMQTRKIRAIPTNWIFFSAMVEAFLFMATGEYDVMRVEYAIMQHEQWYKGDGVYGDGPSFKWDYYNSFVIQTMYLTILDIFKGQQPAWDALHENVVKRAIKYGDVLETMIGQNGTFPPLGRSITYRSGAFHLLSQLSLEHRLSSNLTPAQVRCALTAVIKATLEHEDTFDEHGWLQIGLCGHQPHLGEIYICTGSLYLCSAILLPLGLREDDPFWKNEDEKWTAQKIWN